MVSAVAAAFHRRRCFAHDIFPSSAFRIKAVLETANYETQTTQIFRSNEPRLGEESTIHVVVSPDANALLRFRYAPENGSDR